MIERVIRLGNVGLLRQPLPSGAVGFGRTTLLYGENGRGKSTFAAVCRSLATNDASVLLSRRTLGSVDQPDVLLRVDGANYTFASGNWTGQCDRLVVFDADFVDRNVHSGSRVEAEHRESLLEFALGERGVTIKRRIDAITDEVSIINRDAQALRRGLAAAAPPYSVEEYVALSPEVGIDDEVARLAQQISQSVNSATITRRPLLRRLELPTFDIGPIRQVLGESISSLSRNAWREVEDHIHRLGEGGEQWVHDGLGRVQDNSCPFCAQDLDYSPVFASFGALFGAAYQDLRARVMEARDDAEAMLSPAALDAIREGVSANAAVEATWDDFPEVSFPLALSTEEIAQVWRATRERLVGQLAFKCAEPLVPLELPSDAEMTVGGFGALRARVAAYASAIDAANAQLQAIKDRVAEADLASLQQHLDRSRARQGRARPDAVAACDQLEDLRIRKQALEEEKREARQQLEAHMTQTLGGYAEATNEFLRTFGAGFRIDQFQAAHVGGTPRSEYGLRLMGEPVQLCPREDECRPSFATALSEGDKRTLALAFFFARLEVDDGLAALTIIVDEPVTSLDRGRRYATIAELARLGVAGSQLVALSHDPEFLRDLAQRIGADDITTLQVAREGDYSVLTTCDLDDVCQEPHYRNYSTLLDYLARVVGCDLNGVPRVTREYLEGNLRGRFPMELAGAGNLGGMLRRVRECRDDSPLTRLRGRYEDLDRINDFVSPYCHDAEDRPPRLNDGELRPFVESALDIGRGGAIS